MPEPSHTTDPAHAALLARLTALHAPQGEAERHWVEELAFAAYRQRRLRALEDAALAAIEAVGTSEPDAAPLFRRLAALARYRARVERDLRLALAELDRLRGLRPQQLPGISSAQLRLLADVAEEREASAERCGTLEPAPRLDRGEPEPAIEPEPAAEPAPASRPLNRHQRRRLEAMRRELSRMAA